LGLFAFFNAEKAVWNMFFLIFLNFITSHTFFEDQIWILNCFGSGNPGPSILVEDDYQVNEKG
jgi:hypothetical protein